jgi:dCMP deaminase
MSDWNNVEDPQRKMKWDTRYLEMAQLVSTWSKDPSTKVGAVIVNKDNEVVSVGYNGFPRKIFDTETRLNDRDIKYKMVVHGEVNAMIFAKQDLEGCTLYTFPFMPCSVCAGQVIQHGIKRVVAPYSDNERWVESFKLTREMFTEAGVELVECNTLLSLPEARHVVVGIATPKKPNDPLAGFDLSTPREIM